MICLACAREENAAAGFPGIDRKQSGHVCQRALPQSLRGVGGGRNKDDALRLLMSLLNEVRVDDAELERMTDAERLLLLASLVKLAHEVFGEIEAMP
jgi:hypothetical protein